MTSPRTPTPLAALTDGARRAMHWCRDVIGEAIDDSLGPEADRDAGPTDAVRAVDELALLLARFSAGVLTDEEAYKAAAAAPPRTLWEALERFAHALTGEEWQRATRPLLGLDAVIAEQSALRHWSPVRRAIAARRLGLLHLPELSGALRTAMTGGPSLVTFTAALTLARWGDLPALQWLFDHPESTSRRRRDQLTALVRRFGAAAAPLTRATLEGWTIEAPIHLAGVDALGLWRDPESLPLLERLARGGTIDGRTAATRALGAMGDPVAASTLLAALEDEAWPVRAQAARALGRVDAQYAIEPLGFALRDRAWWVRRHAAFALAALGDDGRAALARHATQDSDPFAAEMAAEALEIGPHVLESAEGIDDVA